MKEAQALRVKNQFQNVVDRLRIFWVDVEAALAKPLMNVIRKAAVQNIGARIVDLTRQLEECVLNLPSLIQPLSSHAANATQPSTNGESPHYNVRDCMTERTSLS